MPAQSKYGAIFALKKARRVLCGLTLGSIATGMLGLTLLLLVKRATGSYEDGGFAVACSGIAGGISAPVRGRALDRFSGRRVLLTSGVGYACSFAALDLASRYAGNLWLLLLLSCSAGWCTPPVFPWARAAWPKLVDQELLRRCYALTSLSGDVGLVVGPVLVTGSWLVSPYAPALLCGSIGLLGAALSAIPIEIRRRSTEVFIAKVLRSRALQGLLATTAAIGGTAGLVQVTIPATAERLRDTSLAGILLAAFALGSVTGVLAFATRARTRDTANYAPLVLLLGILLAPIAAFDDPVGLGVLLLFAGAAFGPATVAIFEALDALIPDRGAEAAAWVATAISSGYAAGAAAAGLLVARTGVHTPFAIASIFLVAVAGLALLRAHARPKRRAPGSSPHLTD